MEQQTVLLIQKLAAQLGTTSEYLWGVLIRQAPISAAIDVFQYVILGIAIYFYVRFLKKHWNDLDEFPLLLCGAVGIIFGMLAIFEFFAMNNTLIAILNPEYWALDKVLGLVKTK